jgi:hypothetical protein
LIDGAGEERRAHAHGAGFTGSVERAASKGGAPVVDEATAYRSRLAMRGWVAVRPSKIAPARKHLSVAHNPAPNGKSACRPSFRAMRMDRSSSADASVAAT